MLAKPQRWEDDKSVSLLSCTWTAVRHDRRKYPTPADSASLPLSTLSTSRSPPSDSPTARFFWPGFGRKMNLRVPPASNHIGSQESACWELGSRGCSSCSTPFVPLASATSRHQCSFGKGVGERRGVSPPWQKASSGLTPRRSPGIGPGLCCESTSLQAAGRSHMVGLARPDRRRKANGASDRRSSGAWRSDGHVRL